MILTLKCLVTAPQIFYDQYITSFSNLQIDGERLKNALDLVHEVHAYFRAIDQKLDL